MSAPQSGQSCGCWVRRRCPVKSLPPSVIMTVTGSAIGAASSPQPKRHVPCPTELTSSDHHLNRFADKPTEITVSIQLSGYSGRN
jgi:hypothetical protein